MPRLLTSLIRHARAIDPLLPLLLRPCRSLPSAQSELRWLKEAASARVRNDQHQNTIASRKTTDTRAYLRHLCTQRGRDVPLQYLLGTEFFGDLELRVRPGVLIPRQETAAAVTHLAQQLVESDIVANRVKQGTPLRILDLCCGTGCMGLLLAYELAKSRTKIQMKILGVDISPRAVALARENTARVTKEHEYMARVGVEVVRADILAGPNEKSKIPSLNTVLREKGKDWDVILANPPYVSEADYFSSQTERSVRCFEPRLALVPEPAQHTNTDSEMAERPEDRFYTRILDTAESVGARAVLMEVGGMAQAERVAAMAVGMRGASEVEVCRDEPEAGKDELTVEGESVVVKGSGEGRSVVVWR